MCVCTHSGLLVGTYLAACARASLHACARVWSAHAPGVPGGRERTPVLGPHLSRVDVITSVSRVWQETQN